MTPIRSVGLRYSLMRGSDKTSKAHRTSEVEPRSIYVLCIAVMAVQRIFFYVRMRNAEHSESAYTRKEREQEKREENNKGGK